MQQGCCIAAGLHTCSLMYLMALPMETESGRHSTRNWMAVFSTCARSRDNILPSGVE